MSIKPTNNGSYTLKGIHSFRFTLDTDTKNGALKYVKAAISFLCGKAVDCDNLKQYVSRFEESSIANYVRKKGLFERIIQVNDAQPKVTVGGHTPPVILLSDVKLREFECSVLDYINAVIEKKYESIEECEFDSLVEVEEFLVDMIAFMSLSETYFKVTISSIIRSILPLMYKKLKDSGNLASLCNQITKEKHDKLRDINEYPIVEMVDDCQEQLRYSTQYFKNKSKGIIGDDEFPKLSRGAYNLFSTNNEVITVIEKKLSHLLEAIDTVQEEHKMAAICNYVVEKLNHEILYSQSRHDDLNFTKDNWSEAAIKERNIAEKHVMYRYDSKNSKKPFFFRYEATEKFKVGEPLSVFGNCDHFADRGLEIIKSLKSVDVEEYDFGRVEIANNDDVGHATAYLRCKDKVMIIDSWKNIYFHLKDYEHFLNDYLGDEFKFEFKPKNNKYIGNSDIGEIKSNVEFSQENFKTKVYDFYKKKLR